MISGSLQPTHLSVQISPEPVLCTARRLGVHSLSATEKDNKVLHVPVLTTVATTDSAI